jgi:hypothetical protein
MHPQHSYAYSYTGTCQKRTQNCCRAFSTETWRMHFELFVVGCLFYILLNATFRLLHFLSLLLILFVVVDSRIFYALFLQMIKCCHWYCRWDKNNSISTHAVTCNCNLRLSFQLHSLSPYAHFASYPVLTHCISSCNRQLIFYDHHRQ